MKPPTYLSKDAREWWLAVADGYALEAQDQRLLTEACSAWDRAQEARAILAKDGIVVPDRYGKPKEHPAVRIEVQNRVLYARLLRQLDLPAPDPATPKWRR